MHFHIFYQKCVVIVTSSTILQLYFFNVFWNVPLHIHCWTYHKNMTQSHLFLTLKVYEPIIKPHVMSVIQHFKLYLMCCEVPWDLQPEMYLRIRSVSLCSRECSTCYRIPLATVYQQHTFLKRGGWTHLWLRRKTHTNIRTGWHLSQQSHNTWKTEWKDVLDFCVIWANRSMKRKTLAFQEIGSSALFLGVRWEDCWMSKSAIRSVCLQCTQYTEGQWRGRLLWRHYLRNSHEYLYFFVKTCHN